MVTWMDYWKWIKEANSHIPLPPWPIRLDWILTLGYGYKEMQPTEIKDMVFFTIMDGFMRFVW